VALAEGMLSVELAKVKDDWLWHNGMTGSMPEVEFGYFGRLGLENTKGRMGYIVGDEEPIACCGRLLRLRAGAKVVPNLAPFSSWCQDRWSNLLCDGWFHCHGTCSMEVSLCMGLDRALRHGLKLHLFGCIGGGGVFDRKSLGFFPMKATIIIDAMYRIWVVSLVITITRSLIYVWFCNIPLLLEFAEMLDL
jgi:hypothetical protein